VVKLFATHPKLIYVFFSIVSKFVSIIMNIDKFLKNYKNRQIVKFTHFLKDKLYIPHMFFFESGGQIIKLRNCVNVTCF